MQFTKTVYGERPDHHTLVAHRAKEIRAAALEAASRIMATEDDAKSRDAESRRDRTLEMARMFEQYIDDGIVPSEDLNELR